MTTGLPDCRTGTNKRPLPFPAFVWTPRPPRPALQSRALDARPTCLRRAPAPSGHTESDDYASVRGLICRTHLVLVRQVHGRAVLVVRPDEPLPGRPTPTRSFHRSGRAIAVRGGLFLYWWPTRHRVVAAIHAGWRGTCAGIVTATIQTMADLGRTRRSDGGDRPSSALLLSGRRPRATRSWASPDAARGLPRTVRSLEADLWQANADQHSGGRVLSAIDVSRMHRGLSTCFSYRAEAREPGAWSPRFGSRELART